MCSQLTLNSPANGDPCIYNWPMGNEKVDGALEIIETIKWVCEDFPEMRLAIDNCILADCDIKSYESMKTVCERFNQVIESLRQMTDMSAASPTRASTSLLRHIIQKAYNHAVTDPDKLNNYEPFSPEVYGETSFEFIAQMVDQIGLNANDTFIDLGSGVGQVVLQIAASTSAKMCIGIEKADVPSAYAEQMEKSFKFWMNWYGKKYSDFQLIKGDFFDDIHRDMINNATFIFVNNFAFGPTVDHMLKLRFAELKDESRIVSSKSFCPLNFRITDRNLSDIGTIMHVQEIQPNIKGSVSWTGKSVSYYHHTIDRRKLENYFMNIKNPKNKNNDENSKSQKIGKLNDVNGNNFTKINSSNDSTDLNSPGDSKSKDEFYFGPTTRKAWSEWCNSRYKENIQLNTSSSINVKVSSLNKKVSDSKVSVSEKRRTNLKSRSSTSKPKKYSPGVTAVVRRATRKKFSGVSQRARRPGRPKKETIKLKKPSKYVNFNGLELLHAQTVLSTSNNAGVRSDPAPGCVDQKLDAIHINSLSTKNNSIMSLVSKNLDNMFEELKNNYLSFIAFMQTPKYKINLIEQIEEEKKRKLVLNSQADLLERTVNNLVKRGVNLLKVRLSELDIVASNSEELVNKAKEIVYRNKELQEQLNVFQEQVNYLDKINNHLTKQANFGNSQSLNIENKLEPESKLLLEINTALGKRSNLINTVEQLQEGVNMLEKSALPNMINKNSESQTINSNLKTNNCATNNSLDSCRFINIEERMKRVIVAALNEKNDSSTSDHKVAVSKSLKKEIRKKIISKPFIEKKFFKSQNENAKEKVESWNNPNKLRQKISSHYDYPDLKSEKSDPKTSLVKISNNTNLIETNSVEEKKPLLMTFKIDRRDNSASVTSPSLSPEKSPSKSPKDFETSQQQRKQYSPDRVKKSRSPKYNSSMQSAPESEKRTPLIIKLNNLQSQKSLVKPQNKIESTENVVKVENVNNVDKSSETKTSQSRSHGLIDGSHRWQTNISNSFEKLVKLAHQFEPKEEIKKEELLIDQDHVAKTSPKRKKNTPKSLTERQHFLLLNKKKLIASKTPPDTPPHTPSPLESPERPLTPSTPPGYNPPLNVDANIINSTTCSEKNKLLSTKSEKDLCEKESYQCCNSSTLPTKCLANNSWQNEKESNSLISNVSCSSSVNSQSNASKLSKKICTEANSFANYKSHFNSLNEIKSDKNSFRETQNSSQSNLNIQSNKLIDQHLFKNSEKITSFNPSQSFLTNVSISSFAHQSLIRNQHDCINYSFSPSQSYQDSNIKNHRKNNEELLTVKNYSSMSKKILRPSRLDAVCKREFNSAIKNFI